MHKVIVSVCTVFYSYSSLYAQDKQLNAKPVYDNMQLEKQHREESKNLTYKQSASMWTGEAEPSSQLALTGTPQPVKRVKQFATPSTFKPQPIQVQPLMKQSVFPTR